VKNVFANIVTASFVFAMTTGPLHAQTRSWWTQWFGGGSTPSRPTPVAVPEIDASSGLLAVAAVLAVLAFVWERRRRQSV